MNIAEALQAITLGVIQGLTEFIPVSSSGHLTIAPKLFGWEQSSTAFILFAHLGTLIALLIYFREDLWGYIKVLWNWIINKGQIKSEDKPELVSIVLIVLAAVPAGLIGLLLDDVISGFYDNPENDFVVTAVTLTAMAALGVVFLFNNRLFTGKKVDMKKLTPVKAVMIGVSQALAFIRGTSRSGITLITGQAAGLNKVSAAKFSFLISIPILLGTSLIGVLKVSELSQPELLQAILGMVAAAASGYLAIKFMLKYLANNSLAVFGWYRIIFAILVMIILLY